MDKDGNWMLVKRRPPAGLNGSGNGDDFRLLSFRVLQHVTVSCFARFDQRLGFESARQCGRLASLLCKCSCRKSDQSRGGDLKLHDESSLSKTVGIKGPASNLITS